MQSSRITKFNFVCGNKPAETPEEVLKQIINQCTFLLEEVLETKEAAYAGDWTEIADGVGDVLFVADYLRELTKSVGVDQDGVDDAICDNNMLKTTTSRELAEKWLEGKDVACYIATTEYEGETYYTVRRKIDDKVVKYNDFPRVDLKPFIPNELQNAD